jgi:hypothetical protein
MSFGIPVRNGLAIGLGTSVGLRNGNLWTPEVANTALWLDGSDTTTITLNSGNVSQWNDKSGNGRNFSQSTATAQPAYTANQLNGLPALIFDGVDDFLDGGQVLDLIGGLAIFMVVRQRSAADNLVQPYMSRANVTTLQNGHWFMRDMVSSQPASVSFASVRLNGGATTYSGSLNGTQDANYHIIGFRYSQTANQIQALRDGASSANAATVGTPVTPTVNCRIASADEATARFANIDVCEIVVLQVSLPAAADPLRQRTEGYLAWKYGLQANLPVTHPYRNAPPKV